MRAVQKTLPMRSRQAAPHLDVLSEVLRTVRLTGATFFSAEFRAPWGFTSPLIGTVAGALDDPDAHLVLFHLVLEGRATARVEGAAEVALEAGDIVAFPQGHAHRVWQGRPARWYDTSPAVQRALAGDLQVTRAGGVGDVTRFVCGYFSCDRWASEVVLAGLPSMLTVSVRDGDRRGWLEEAVQFLAAEAASDHAGRSALLTKLSEALFVETLRRWMNALPAGQTGWLAGARDDVVGPCTGTASPAAGSPVDPRHAGARRGLLAIEAGRALRALPERAADGLPRAVAFAARRAPACHPRNRACLKSPGASATSRRRRSTGRSDVRTGCRQAAIAARRLSRRSGVHGPPEMLARRADLHARQRRWPVGRALTAHGPTHRDGDRRRRLRRRVRAGRRGTDGHGGQDRAADTEALRVSPGLPWYRRGRRERIHRRHGAAETPGERVGPAYGRPPDRVSPGDHKPRGFHMRACDRWDSLDPQPRGRAAHSRAARVARRTPFVLRGSVSPVSPLSPSPGGSPLPPGRGCDH